MFALEEGNELIFNSATDDNCARGTAGDSFRIKSYQKFQEIKD